MILNLESISDSEDVRSHLEKLQKEIKILQNKVKKAKTVELEEIREKASEINTEIYEDT